jgi:hypothetical protein
MTEEVSKMQKILDKAEAEFDAGNGREAFMQLIEAIKMLSLAQQQMFDRVDSVANRNPFIGGCDEIRY